MTSKNSGLMVEREGNSIMSKRWKILLINFCQIDKYLEKKLLSGQTFLEHKKFDQNVPMFYILVVLQGLCGRLENVFDIVSGRYTVTIVVIHCYQAPP